MFRTSSCFYEINLSTRSFNILSLASKTSRPSVNSAKLINPFVADSLIDFSESWMILSKSSINFLRIICFRPKGELHIFVYDIAKGTMQFVESSLIVVFVFLMCLNKTEMRSELFRH